MKFAAILLAIVSLETGLGNTHWSVSTKNHEAQQYLDRKSVV